MNTKRLERTSLRVSEICFGAMKFSAQAAEADFLAFLHFRLARQELANTSRNRSSECKRRCRPPVLIAFGEWIVDVHE